MRDVARKAGVSITTVSHVINNTRPVAAKTRARVLREIDRLDYYKNSSARLLVRGRSDLFGLIISDIENPFFPELIKSFEEACTREGLDALLCATNYDRSQAEKSLKRMLENRVQAVAIMTSQFDPKLIAHLAEKNIPLVRLGARPLQKNCSTIDVHYQTGVAGAVRHLVELGHKKIAIAAGPQTQVSAIEYRQAVERAINEAGLKPTKVLEGDHGPESGALAAKSLLSAGLRPTAIVCGNDRMAIGAIGAIVDMGLRVPADVSIVGSDDVWMSRYCHPPLTTVRIPRDDLGRLAFEVLFEMLNAKKQMGQRRVLETDLIIRRSTGAAPQGVTNRI
jgi:LacI family transcriptional regulator